MLFSSIVSFDRYKSVQVVTIFFDSIFNNSLYEPYNIHNTYNTHFNKIIDIVFYMYKFTLVFFI